MVAKHPFPESHVSLERLSDLRRRYWAEAEDLRLAIDEAHADLEQWNRTHCLLSWSVAANASVTQLYDDLHEGVRCLERDLSEVQSAILGIDDEILELEARETYRRQVPRKSGNLAVAAR